MSVVIHINKQNLSKVSLGCALAAAVFMTGCNDTATTETVEGVDTVNDTAVVASEDVDTNSSASADSDELVMTTITLDTVDQMLFVPLLTNGELSQEQVSCLEARDKDLGKSEVDAFYKSKFSDAELASLNEFYASDVGQKLLDFGNEQLLIMNGQQVAEPMPDPTPEEMAEIQTFMESPLGVKYMEVNNAEGAGSAMEVINAPINAEFKRCNIDIEL
ncbi:MAG: DUF2059 domain-containing protein [Psychrobacter sp.]|nr:DUF2059 domain-containing protein [Psychrobacter sp.]